MYSTKELLQECSMKRLVWGLLEEMDDKQVSINQNP